MKPIKVKPIKVIWEYKPVDQEDLKEFVYFIGKAHSDRYETNVALNSLINTGKYDIGTKNDIRIETLQQNCDNCKHCIEGKFEDFGFWCIKCNRNSSLDDYWEEEK